MMPYRNEDEFVRGQKAKLIVMGILAILVLLLRWKDLVWWWNL